MPNFTQSDFVNGNYGAKYYGVTKEKREQLLSWFHRNVQNIPSGTPAITHAKLASFILEIPPFVKGDIIELGCYKGASAASLSLISEIVKRKLIVADSFEGLPDEKEKLHLATGRGHIGYYAAKSWAGTLQEVKNNITTYGSINNCEFLVGYYKDSLKQLKNPVSFVFSDVDLYGSQIDALKYVWGLLVEGGIWASDDAGDCDVISPFFDHKFFKDNFNSEIPGFIGSGIGEVLDGSESQSFGHTIKIDRNKIKKPSEAGLNKSFDFFKFTDERHNQ